MANKNQLRRILLALFIALAIIFAAGPSYASQATTATEKSVKTVYIKKSCKLLKSANASAKLLVKLPKGAKAECLSTNGAWARVRYDGKTGYTKKTLLSNTPIDTPEPTGEAAYAKSKGYLYKSAKTSSKKLTTVKKGAELVLYSTSGNWCKVKVNGKTGYFHKSRVIKTEPATDTGDTTVPTTSDPDDSGNTTLQSGDKGDAVKALQQRLKSLNWFYGEIGGNYLTQTEQAVKDFQSAAKLNVTGIADVKTQKALFASNAPRCDFSDYSTSKPASGAVQEMDWWKSDISAVFARGSFAVVTDVRTGISFRVYRGGGTNHADVQPATAKDTEAMKRIYGGAWSWDRRAITVSIGGKRYAASMNGMPHGSSSISGNNFNGHFCIHFTSSRTHGSNKVCPLHQAAIQEALRAG